MSKNHIFAQSGALFKKKVWVLLICVKKPKKVGVKLTKSTKIAKNSKKKCEFYSFQNLKIGEKVLIFHAPAFREGVGVKLTFSTKKHTFWTSFSGVKLTKFCLFQHFFSEKCDIYSPNWKKTCFLSFSRVNLTFHFFFVIFTPENHIYEKCPCDFYSRKNTKNS